MVDLGFVGVFAFGIILHAIWGSRWRWAQPGGAGREGGINFVGCFAVLIVFSGVNTALGIRFDAAAATAADRV